MAITAAMVKELRETTGAGMMDCKKALTTSKAIWRRLSSFLHKNMLPLRKKLAVLLLKVLLLLISATTAKVGVMVKHETNFVGLKLIISKNWLRSVAHVATANPHSMEHCASFQA